MKKVKKQSYKDMGLQRGIDYIGVTVVFFCHDGKGKYLLHKRSKNCRDEIGNWDPGGGSMEHGESFEEAVRREVKEEYSVEAKELMHVGTWNVVRKNNKTKSHWVAIIFKVKVDSDKVKIGDPEKMDEIGWFEEENWPNPLHSKFKEIWQSIKDS